MLSLLSGFVNGAKTIKSDLPQSPQSKKPDLKRYILQVIDLLIKQQKEYNDSESRFAIQLLKIVRKEIINF